MKRILSAILMIVISIGLIGCENKSTDVFNFDYAIKDEYADEIGKGLAEAFIEFTKDTKEIYDTSLDEFFKDDPIAQFEILDISDYMRETTRMYQSFDYWNGQENQMIEFMNEQGNSIFNLALLKTEYTTYKLQLKNNSETEYTEEYFQEGFNRIKSEIEKNLENAKVFIK